MDRKPSSKPSVGPKVKNVKVVREQSVDEQQQGVEKREVMPTACIYRFQNKSAPNKLVKAVRDIYTTGNASAFRDILRPTGFFGLTKLSVTRMDRGFIQMVLQLYDKETKSFRLGDGKFLKVGPDDVRRVYDLPVGGTPINLSPNTIRRGKLLGDELGLSFSSANLVKCDAVRTKMIGEQDPEKRVKMFVLYSLACLLAPSAENRINLNYAEYVHDVDIISKYDWCQHVYEVLISGLDKYVDSKEASPLLKGDFHFVFVHFLDCLLYGDEMSSDIVPTCVLWSKEVVTQKLRNLKSFDDICRGRVMYPGRSGSQKPTMKVKSSSSAEPKCISDNGCDDAEFDMTLSEAVAAQAEGVAQCHKWMRMVDRLNIYIGGLVAAGCTSTDAVAKAEDGGGINHQVKGKADDDGTMENPPKWNPVSQCDATGTESFPEKVGGVDKIDQAVLLICHDVQGALDGEEVANCNGQNKDKSDDVCEEGGKEAAENADGADSEKVDDDAVPTDLVETLADGGDNRHVAELGGDQPESSVPVDPPVVSSPGKTSILLDETPEQNDNPTKTILTLPRQVKKGPCVSSPYAPYTRKKRSKGRLTNTERKVVQYVRGAVTDNPADMIVFDDDITFLSQNDMLTLNDDAWINTNVVSSFVYYLNRAERKKRFTETIFLPVTMSQGSVNKDVQCDDKYFIKRFDSFLRSISIRKSDMVKTCKYFVFPVLCAEHYAVVVINMLHKRYHWVDTLPHSEKNYNSAKIHVSTMLRNVLCWLIHHEVVDKSVSEWDWDISTVFDQGDGLSCGLHCMRLMENINAVIKTRTVRDDPTQWSDWTNEEIMTFHRAKIVATLVLQDQNKLKDKVFEASLSVEVTVDKNVEEVTPKKTVGRKRKA